MGNAVAKTIGLLMTKQLNFDYLCPKAGFSDIKNPTLDWLPNPTYNTVFIFASRGKENILSKTLGQESYARNSTRLAKVAL